MIDNHVDNLIAAANYLTSMDETELGLKVLEMLPAEYRDQVPPRIAEHKAFIQGKIMTPYDLLSDRREMPKSVEICLCHLNNTARGMVLKTELELANKDGVRPYIIDMGPGDFCFPLALKQHGFDFTYNPLTLNAEAKLAANKLLVPEMNFDPKDRGPHEPTWFVAYEIIEHLPDINQILGAYHRYAAGAQKIFLSTPKYTYADGTQNWQTEGIHHLRAYTPMEFLMACKGLFPHRNWTFVDNEVMVLIGI